MRLISSDSLIHALNVLACLSRTTFLAPSRSESAGLLFTGHGAPRRQPRGRQYLASAYRLVIPPSPSGIAQIICAKYKESAGTGTAFRSRDAISCKASSENSTGSVDTCHQFLITHSEEGPVGSSLNIAVIDTDTFRQSKKPYYSEIQSFSNKEDEQQACMTRYMHAVEAIEIKKNTKQSQQRIMMRDIDVE